MFEPLEAGGVQFREALAPTPETVATIEAQVRRRVLRRVSRHGLLDPDDARDMLAWDNSGFSLDACVRIAGRDRPGLERLLRCCARPPFALERIEQVNEDRIVYRLPRPQRDGRTALSLTPLELIARLVAQLENKLAAATAAPPPLPRRAGTPCAAASGRHRLRARWGPDFPATTARGFTARCRGTGTKRPLPGALPLGTAHRPPIPHAAPGLPELRCR